MFEARYRITIETTADRDLLRHGLENLAEELMCDLEYQDS